MCCALSCIQVIQHLVLSNTQNFYIGQFEKHYRYHITEMHGNANHVAPILCLIKLIYRYTNLQA